jgi:hypothetical protein
MVDRGGESRFTSESNNIDACSLNPDHRLFPSGRFILNLIFGLVFLTIAITIVRGDVFHVSTCEEKGECIVQHSPGSGSVASLASVSHITHFYCLFFSAIGSSKNFKLTDRIEACIIACIISFRKRFVQRRKKAYERNQVGRWRG